MLAASNRLGPYKILAPVGAGGMGSVDRAELRADQVPVRLLALQAKNQSRLPRPPGARRQISVWHPLRVLVRLVPMCFPYRFGDYQALARFFGSATVCFRKFAAAEPTAEPAARILQIPTDRPGA